MRDPSRHYDPTTGTFLTKDPLGVGAEPEGRPTSANLFAYVGNDPLNYQDPLGLCRVGDVEFTMTGELIRGKRGLSLTECQGLEEVDCENRNIYDEATGLVSAEWTTFCGPDTGPLITWLSWEQVADISGRVGDAVAVVEVGGLALVVLGGPEMPWGAFGVVVAGAAATVGTSASAVELSAGLLAGDDKHITAGAIGLVTFGVGRSVTVISRGVGASGKAQDVVELITAIYEGLLSYNADQLISP